MKKIFYLFCVFTLISFSHQSTGQVFYGEGVVSVGMLHASTTQKVMGNTSKKISAFGLECEVAPGIGMFLSEQLGVGLRTGYSFKMIPEIGTHDTLLMTSHGFNILPYANYAFFSIGNFSVYASMGMGFTYSTQLRTGLDGKVTPTSLYSNAYIFEIGVTPGMQYLIKDRWILYTDLKFLELGYRFTRTGYTEDADNSNWENKHEFICAVNSRDIFALTKVKFGLLYIF